LLRPSGSREKRKFIRKLVDLIKKKSQDNET
jgi:hypothetical protein